MRGAGVVGESGRRASARSGAAGRRRAGRAFLALLAAAALGCAPEPAAERPLRIALYDAPSSADPHEVNEFITFAVLSHLYEPLVTLDAELRAQPALAERWDNPDERTWRFFLRPGARFHDGAPLTAADVVATFDRVRRQAGGDFAGYLVDVTAARALDAHTVEIATARPAALLLRKLAFVLVVPAAAPARITEPVGSGPYRLVSWEKGRIAMAGWDGHWAGPPPLPQLELLSIVDPRERKARLLAGDVDVAQALRPEDASSLAGAEGVRVAMREGLAVEFLALRIDRPPLADARVRQALSLAIDRQALVDQLLDGHGRPTLQIVPPTAVGFDPDLAAPRRDPAAARRLLAEAGFAGGIDLDFEYRAGRDVEPLRRQLAEAGIRMHPVGRSWDELIARVDAGKVAAYYAAVVTETADASDVLDSLAHSRQPDRGWGADNSSGYANAELDALIEASGEAMRPLERRENLQRCLRILSRDLPFIPLLVPHEIYGVRADLEWQPRLDGNVLAQEMRRRPR